MTYRPSRWRLTRALPPSARFGQTSGPESAARPVVISMVVAIIVLFLAGLAWPHAADGLLRLLLVSLAVGFFADRAYHVVPPAITTQDPYSPFGRDTAGRRPPAAPRALRKLIGELDAAGDSRSAQPTAIPPSVKLTVRNEVSRRLSERHGLSLHAPAHHRQIQSLLSEPTWVLVRPDEPQARAGTGLTTSRPSVPLSRLGRILDDLERL